MQEEFLHYIWNHKKFNFSQLKTTNNKVVTISSIGNYNKNTGPDFFNAQLKIEEQLWAGNVEIHVKSSDWYLHNHETDSNYDNVILHVVWEHDSDVFRKDNSIIPTLELKPYVSKDTINNYSKLFSKSQKWINCEKDYSSVDKFTLTNWLERLYFERLERKSEIIKQLLEDSKNNWEATLFCMLAKNFGLKINGDAFLSIVKSVEFSIIRKINGNQINLEALFFGQAGLLENDVEDTFHFQLKKEYDFLKHKFHLSNKHMVPVQFFRLRPSNFPTIRLSQLANLYSRTHDLFSKIIELQSIDDFNDLFSAETSPYWESHYTFGKGSKSSKKRVSKSFINLIMINTVIPIKFSYAQYLGKPIDQEIMNLVMQIPSEKNSIVEKFLKLKTISSSALESQALIQLKNEYCDKNRCLQCAIGNEILTRIH
jgi:hypothetical protein